MRISREGIVVSRHYLRVDPCRFGGLARDVSREHTGGNERIEENRGA